MLQKQVSAPVVCIKLTGRLYFYSLLRLNDNAFYNPPTNFRALLSATLRHVVQNRPTIITQYITPVYVDAYPSTIFIENKQSQRQSFTLNSFCRVQ